MQQKAATDAMFSQLDANNDGIITRAELQTEMSKEAADAVFEKLDANHDGVITRAELEVGIAKEAQLASEPCGGGSVVANIIAAAAKPSPCGNTAAILEASEGAVHLPSVAEELAAAALATADFGARSAAEPSSLPYPPCPAVEQPLPRYVDQLHHAQQPLEPHSGMAFVPRHELAGLPADTGQLYAQAPQQRHLNPHEHHTYHQQEVVPPAFPAYPGLVEPSMRSSIMEEVRAVQSHPQEVAHANHVVSEPMTLTGGTLPGSPRGVLPGSPRGARPSSPRGVLPGSPRGALPGSPRGVGAVPPASRQISEPHSEVHSPRGSHMAATHFAADGHYAQSARSSLLSSRQDDYATAAEEVMRLVDAHKHGGRARQQDLERYLSGTRYEEFSRWLMGPKTWPTYDTHATGSLRAEEMTAALRAYCLSHGVDPTRMKHVAQDHSPRGSPRNHTRSLGHLPPSPRTSEAGRATRMSHDVAPLSHNIAAGPHSSRSLHSSSSHEGSDAIRVTRVSQSYETRPSVHYGEHSYHRPGEAPQYPPAAQQGPLYSGRSSVTTSTSPRGTLSLMDRDIMAQGQSHSHRQSLSDQLSSGRGPQLSSGRGSLTSTSPRLSFQDKGFIAAAFDQTSARSRLSVSSRGY